MSGDLRDVPGQGRYYANPNEQKILVHGLQKYFSLPERSHQRNEVAKNVSCLLQRWSPHWTHRAVRLWFNNNKHTYLHGTITPDIPTYSYPIPGNMPSNIPTNLPGAIPGNMPGSMQYPMGVPPPVMPIHPVQVQPNLSFNRPPVEAQRPIPTVTIPPVAPRPIPTISIVPTANPPQKFQALKPLSFMQQDSTQKEPSPEQAYIPLKELVNEIQRTPEKSPKLPKLLSDFDNGCEQMTIKYGTVNAERVQPQFKYVRFPFNNEISAAPPSDFSALHVFSEFSFGDFGNMSFTGGSQLFGSENKESRERPRNTSIWQVRVHEDFRIPMCENTAVSREYAAYVSAPYSSGNRTVSISRYKNSISQWVTKPIPIAGAVDSMCIGDSTVWCLADSVICKVPFAVNDSSLSVRVPITNGIVTRYGSGAVAASCDSNVIAFVTTKVSISGVVQLPYNGLTCISSMGDKLIGGITGSGTVRLFTPEGIEERAFVGHCGQVTGLEQLSDVLFASHAMDNTVRIWDVRDRNQCSAILLPQVNVVSMTGSASYIVCGFSNKTLGVVDLKIDRGYAKLGVSTQDYVAASMSFDPHDDSLVMFGMDDTTRTVFVENDSQNRNRVFRKYTKFIGN